MTLPQLSTPCAALSDVHAHALTLTKRVLTDVSVAAGAVPTAAVIPEAPKGQAAPEAPALKSSADLTGVTPAQQETIDANAAVARVAYAMSDQAFLYPITPATGMSQSVDVAAVNGRKNAWDHTVKTFEMQSEIGVAGAIHGALCAGALTTGFTCSQGLLLTVPTMYRMAGDLLPAVIHCASRAVSTTTSDIFCDYSDVMACRQTGWGMLHSTNVQEAQDLAVVSHLSAWRCSLPFLHWFDGFRVSHELNKISTVDTETIKRITSMPQYQAAIRRFRAMSQHPDHPVVRGAIGNMDTHWQAFERNHVFYEEAADKVQDAMDDFAAVTGRQYRVFDYLGAEDATDVIVMMGSGSGAVENTVRELNAKAGAKVGLVRVRLYRPFSAKHLIRALPKTCKRVCVLDKVKEPGAAAGEPLYLDVQAALAAAADGADFGAGCPPPPVERVINGIYGVGGAEFTVPQTLSVFANMALPGDAVRRRFTVGLNDDLNGLSLPVPTVAEVADAGIETIPPGTKECIFYGLGSDGTVGATQSALKMFAENTDLYTQGYNRFEAFKAGGITVSHLRLSPHPLTTIQYPVDRADYLAVHHPMYIERVNVAEQLREGGAVVINAPWSAAQAVEHLPAKFREQVAAKNGRVFIIDAASVASEAGLPPSRISNVLMSVFFKLGGVLPYEQSMSLFENVIKQTFARKGQSIVDQNITASKLAADRLKEVLYDRDEWLGAVEAAAADGTEAQVTPEELAALGHSVDPARVMDALREGSASGYVSDAILESAFETPLSETRERWLKNVSRPFAAREGPSIPVSSFLPGGVAPTGTMRVARRGIGSSVPLWDAKKCISCMKCVSSCSHAALRPIVAPSQADLLERGAPEGFTTAKAKLGKKFSKLYKDARLRIQLSAEDCTSCYNCATVCPVDAFSARSIDAARESEGDLFNWLEADSGLETEATNPALAAARDPTVLPRASVKGAAMQHAYHGQSGACAGCGLVTTFGLLGRLCGDRLSVANATGCSSVITAPYPNSACSVDEHGKGPAWARSLFENAAEFGLGMQMTYTSMRAALRDTVSAGLQGLEGDSAVSRELVSELTAWASDEDHFNVDAARAHADRILELLGETPTDVIARHAALRDAVALHDHLPRISQWTILGDGAATDIGSAGVDHALASGQDFNLLVLDTEQYSNTGGQISKSSPPSVAGSLYNAGKTGFKRDLGIQAMTYGNVFVASIAMGYDMDHAAKALAAAEAYPGPSLVVALAPCKDHGLPGTKSTVGVSVANGMDKAQEWQKNAVESGYWPVYTFDPRSETPLALRCDPLKDGEAVCARRLAEHIASEGRFKKIKDAKRAAETKKQLINTFIRAHKLRTALAGAGAADVAATLEAL